MFNYCITSSSAAIKADLKMCWRVTLRCDSVARRSRLVGSQGFGRFADYTYSCNFSSSFSSSSFFSSTSNQSPMFRPPDEQIHILGIGNIGKLFAHALSLPPNPAPVTLLFHRPSLTQEWLSASNTLTITQNSISIPSTTLSTELISDPSLTTPIKNLIVSTKATKTVGALNSIKHRLNSESTILFAQNGMGGVEEVDRQLFNDQCRPRYLSCMNSHGVFARGTFESVWAGVGFVAISELLGFPWRKDEGEWRESTLVKSLLATSSLNARVVDPHEFLNLQLEKLAVNSVVNSLTTIFDCQTGKLFSDPRVFTLMRGLLAEISTVFKAMPEVEAQAGAGERFDAVALERIVLDMAGKTAGNTSSMLQDMRAGRETEVEFINGFVCRMGREHGVECEMNGKLVEMVKGKTVITHDQIDDWFR